MSDVGVGHESLLRSSRHAFDFRKIEPEMPVIVVFAEDKLALGPDDGIAELIAIAPLFKN